MRFAVLGTLQVFSDDGVPTPIRPGKVQLVLAVLLSRTGRPVSISELVDALWPADPPPSAIKTARINVTRLRQDLGDERRVVSGPSGYAIRLAPTELDALTFVERVEMAGKARRAGDFDIAVDLIDQALALWRGTPYSGLEDCPSLRPAVEQLNEVRFQAEEDRAEIGLACGQHAGVLPGLTAVVAQHPYRERSTGQLMLALYRSGRRAEALQVYRNTRALLVEQLGVEPGRSLTELHEAILRSDPALELGRDPDQRSRATVGQRPPMEVPADLASFTGRVEETTRITTLLRESDRSTAIVATTIVAVAGVGGIGKSAMAIHAAHVVADQFPDRFPDGVLYVNLRGATPGLEPLAPVEVLGRFLRSLGLVESGIPNSADEAAARFRTLSAHCRILVVLDDAADANQIRPLLPGGSGNAVLVTSRRVLGTLDGAHHIHLGALSELDALALLGATIGRDRIRHEPAEAREIVRYCGRIPLAVRVAGARLAARPDWSLGLFADRLADTRRRLDELRHADLEVRSSFSISLAGLDARARRMFELLGLMEVEQVSAPLSAAIAQVGLDEAQATLEQLVEAQLLEPRSRERYALHDLIRLYAHDEAIGSLPELERVQAIRRGMLHYLGTARNALRVLATMTEPRLTAGVAQDQITVPVTELESRADAALWVETETASLLSIAKQAAGLGDDPGFVVGLAAASTTLFRTRGNGIGEVTINELAIEAAEQLADQHDLAQACNDFATGALAAGRINDALSSAERALALWRRMDFPTGEAQTLNLLGNICVRKGHPEQALARYYQALTLRRELGQRESQAAILTNIGNLLREQGDLGEALLRFEEALTLYRSEGSIGGEAFALGNLGKAHQLMGKLDHSVAILERAVSLAVESAQLPFAAEFRWFLGESLYALGLSTEASAHWHDVIVELRDIGVLSAVEADQLLHEATPRMPQWLR